jgi:hypothetical protein
MLEVAGHLIQDFVETGCFEKARLTLPICSDRHLMATKLLKMLRSFPGHFSIVFALFTRALAISPLISTAIIHPMRHLCRTSTSEALLTLQSPICMG